MKQKNKDKVYCIDCVYVDGSEYGYDSNWCHKVLRHKDTPMELEEVHAIPNKHNKYNNCPYYKKKSWWQKLCVLFPYIILLIMLFAVLAMMVKQYLIGG